MLPPVWRDLVKNEVTVEAKPVGLWTKVCDYIEAPLKLRIEAKGTWKITGDEECGPDGLRTHWPADSLLTSVPAGALIGMIGGSPAEKPGEKSTVFSVGSYLVLCPADTIRGALYLTMNDSVARFEEHSGTVTAKLQIAR